MVSQTSARFEPNIVNEAQTATNPSQGTSGQAYHTNNLNLGFSDQLYQAANTASNNANHAGFVPSHEPNSPVNNVVDLTQIDGANHLTPVPATTHIQGFSGPPQAQSHISPGPWTQYLSNEAMNHMDLDVSSQPEPQGGPGMVFNNDFQVQPSIQNQQLAQNRQTTYNAQATPNEQASKHQQATEKHAQEHRGQQQSTEGEPAQQVLADDDDLFGDRIYYAMLGPIIEFNKQN